MGAVGPPELLALVRLVSGRCRALLAVEGQHMDPPHLTVFCLPPPPPSFSAREERKNALCTRRFVRINVRVGPQVATVVVWPIGLDSILCSGFE